jgi:hypothetical protein
MFIAPLSVPNSSRRRPEKIHFRHFVGRLRPDGCRLGSNSGSPIKNYRKQESFQICDASDLNCGPKGVGLPRGQSPDQQASFMTRGALWQRPGPSSDTSGSGALDGFGAQGPPGGATRTGRGSFDTAPSHIARRAPTTTASPKPGKPMTMKTIASPIPIGLTARPISSARGVHAIRSARRPWWMGRMAPVQGTLTYGQQRARPR